MADSANIGRLNTQLFSDILETTDAAGSTSTTYSMALDDTFSGTLRAGTSDWIAVDLDAGVNYVFSLWGTGGSSNGITDTVLTLRNSNGGFIDVNDDHAANENVRFSVLEYSPSQSGTYYLEVEGKARDSGDYKLSVADDVFDVSQIAAYLTEIYWGFPTQIAFDASAGDTLTYNVNALNADGERLAVYALEAWGNLTGINFQNTTSDAADITFNDDQAGAFAGPSALSPLTGEIFTSNVNVGTQWLVDYGTTIDSFGFLTYMHEVGHALGLGHGGDYSLGDTYGVDNHYRNDSYQMTVMSYFTQAENTFVGGRYVDLITPSLADVAAIQMLYGTGTQYNSGDTIWGYGNTVDGYLGDFLAATLDGAALSATLFSGDDFGFTIVDTGGHDTVNFAGSVDNMVIDLTPANTGGVFGDGLVIAAENTLLEDIVSGSGADTLTGNRIANMIEAGSGNDIANGMLGSDEIYGGAGNDTLDGGLSGDTLYGGAGDDTLLGGTSVDRLYGGIGHDDMRGGTGADTLYGEDGNDSIFGNTGVDLVYGGAGDDFISPGNGVDTVFGGDGNDHIIGRTGFDVLYGEAGDDSMFGSEGQDVMFGGTENDFMSGGFGFDTLEGGAGDDTLYGNIGEDTLYGGDDDDILFGATGNDVLFGGNGNDTLYGAQGTDTLEGGAGDDVILSGSGNDVFIFNLGDGNDTLTNFRMAIPDEGVGDTIILGTGVAGAATTGQEVVEMFGDIVNGNVVLRFDADLSLTFDTHSEFATLADSLSFEIA